MRLIELIQKCSPGALKLVKSAASSEGQLQNDVTSAEELALKLSLPERAKTVTASIDAMLEASTGGGEFLASIDLQV